MFVGGVAGPFCIVSLFWHFKGGTEVKLILDCVELIIFLLLLTLQAFKVAFLQDS